MSWDYLPEYAQNASLPLALAEKVNIAFIGRHQMSYRKKRGREQDAS
jgi:hypothetical protein